MFFAVISLGISLFLLLTSWDNGRMLVNARALWQDVKPTIDRINAEKTAAGSDVQWSRLQDRIEELQGRVARGDKGALYYLDNLKRDMELMRDYTTDRSARWFEDATRTLAQAREELQRNGPAAAARLKKLAEDVKTLAALYKAKPPEDEKGSE